MASTSWRKLPLSVRDLHIDTVLRCGQAFRWRQVNDEWRCTLQGRILSLKQDQTHLHYRATFPQDHPPQDDTPSLINTYFSLHLSLLDLYAQWSRSDPNFALRAISFTGIRMLNQPAWEALVAFICSSNNNISRISQMCAKLCTHYGPFVASLDGEEYHDFPTPEQLAVDGVEERLRGLGFGYRAKYIADTARIIVRERPGGWLDSLRNPKSPASGSISQGTRLAPEKGIMPDEKEPPTYKSAHEALLMLTGVGPKVADCVCLMGLGWSEAVPVDTHVWQIAQRDYSFGLKHKSKTFNKAVHDAVGDHFRGIWGEYAGWAQSVLFTANLKSFADVPGSSSTSPVKKRRKVEVKEEVKVEEVGDEDGLVVKREAVVKVEEDAAIKTTSRKRKAPGVKLETARDALVVRSEAGGTISETIATSVRRSKRIRAN